MRKQALQRNWLARGEDYLTSATAARGIEHAFTPPTTSGNETVSERLELPSTPRAATAKIHSGGDDVDEQGGQKNVSWFCTHTSIFDNYH
jgi:hypothetical protein